MSDPHLGAILILAGFGGLGLVLLAIRFDHRRWREAEYDGE